MQLNTVYELRFEKGQVYQVNYYLTTDVLTDETLAADSLWLVISIDGNEDETFYLSKPASILKQPKEVIEIIVQRETIYCMHRPITPAFPEA